MSTPEILLAELISTLHLVGAGRGLILLGVCSGDLNALLSGFRTWPLGSFDNMNSFSLLWRVN